MTNIRNILCKVRPAIWRALLKILLHERKDVWYTESEVIEMNLKIAEYKKQLWESYIKPMDDKLKEDAKIQQGKAPMAILSDTKQQYEYGPLIGGKYELPKSWIHGFFAFPPSEETIEKYKDMHFPLITSDMTEIEMLNVGMHREMSFEEAEVFRFFYPKWFD